MGGHRGPQQVLSEMEREIDVLAHAPLSGAMQKLLPVDFAVVVLDGLPNVPSRPEAEEELMIEGRVKTQMQ